MKRPKTLWIGFSSETKSYRVYEHDPHLAYAKPYHLHPGNEPTRAQIVKDLNYLYECPSPMGAAMVAKRFGVGFKGMRFV